MIRALFISLVLLAGICRPGVSQANPVYVQGCGNASGATNTTIACAPGTVSAGSVIAGAVSFEGTSATITGCADGTNTYVIVANTLVRDNTNVRSVQGFYAENVAAGTPTITCTVSASVARRGIVIAEISGAKTSGSLDQSIGQSQINPGIAQNSITSTPVTTTTDGQFIFGASADMSVSCTARLAGTGFTLRNYSTCAGIPVQSESLVQTTAGSIAATLTVNSPSDDWGTIIMTFKSASSTFWIDKAGSNSNTCAQAATAASNRSLAKLTIAHTTFNCITVPGDTVKVGDGTYNEAQISVNVDGLLGNPITLQAEHQWLAIINSSSPTLCQANIVTSKSYVIIDGLSLTIDPTATWCTPDSTTGTGVRAFALSGQVGLIVRNIKTDDPSDNQGRKYRSHGVKSNQADTLVEGNTLGAGVETLGADRAIIRLNIITGGGYWNNGIVTKGGGHDVQVYRNIIFAPVTMTGAGIVMGGANAADNPVQECWNCIAYANIVTVPPNVPALSFQGAKDSLLAYNTVLSGGIASSDGPTPSSNINVQWLNNAIGCNGGAASGGLTGSYTIDYNNFFGCTSPPAQTHAVSGDPLYVSTTDFRTQGASPLRRAGTPYRALTFAGLPFSTSCIDYRGRPCWTPPDVGAYQASSGDPANTRTAASSRQAAGARTQATTRQSRSQ